MKKFLAFLAIILLFQGVMTVSAQTQNAGRATSSSVIVGDLKITIFELGVVAGDMKTGKVIWRKGFIPGYEGPVYVIESLIVIKNFVFFKKICQGLCPIHGILADAISGAEPKLWGSVIDFLLFEGDNFYFDSSDPFQLIYDSGAVFGLIRITKLDIISKQMRIVLFDPNSYLIETTDDTKKDKK